MELAAVFDRVAVPVAAIAFPARVRSSPVHFSLLNSAVSARKLASRCVFVCAFRSQA